MRKLWLTATVALCSCWSTVFSRLPADQLQPLPGGSYRLSGAVTACGLQFPAQTTLEFQQNPENGLQHAILGAPTSVFGHNLGKGTELFFYSVPQARAGDLRMSRQFETVSSAFAERLGVEVGADLNRIASLPVDDREAALATLDARHPVLRRIVGVANAPSQALSDSIVGVAWRALTPTAQAFVTQVGVAGVVNVGASGIYEALKKIATVAVG